MASAEQKAQFQEVKAVIKEVVQIVKNMEPDPDGSYMSAIHTLYNSTLPLELVKPDDRLLQKTLFGKCDALGKTYGELLAPALAKYEIALEQARKIPPHIDIDGILVSDFISCLETEKKDLLAIPNQAVEILKGYARVCFFEKVFNKKIEFLGNINNLMRQVSSNTIDGKIKIKEERLNMQKFNKHVDDPQKWKTAIDANYEHLLSLYKTQSIQLKTVPVPKGTKAKVFKMVVPLYSLKDILSISLQRALRQNAILQREATTEVVMWEADQLSSEVSTLHKSRNRMDSDSYKNKRKNLLEKLDAYEDKYTKLMKEVKINFSKIEALLEAEENVGNLHLSSFYKNDLKSGIKVFTYAKRMAVFPSKNKLLLLMEHAGKEKQEIFQKLLDSADHLEIICKHCFENSSVLGGSKEFSEVPPSLLYKVVSMLIDNYQSLSSSIDQAIAGMEQMAITGEEKEIAATLVSFSAAVSDIKEWLDMHLAYFHTSMEGDPHTDQEVREYIHRLFTPEKELLQAQEELASKNAAALLAELELEKNTDPATSSSAKAPKTKARPSSSKQKKAHVDPIAMKPEIRSKAAASAEASAALANDLAEFKAWAGEMTSEKIKEAAEATRKHTAPLDINSPLTDLMITVGKAVHAAERIGKHYEAALQQLDEHDPQRHALQKESGKWHNKAAEQKVKLHNLGKQDLRLRLEKARTLFLEYPSGELFAFLLKHQGITSIVPHGYSDLKVHRYPCFRKDLNGNPWLDSTGNPVYDWIEPYKIYTGKNKYAVLHAHINPEDASECTALHFKRRKQDLLGRQYEIRQAKAGNEERIYRKKANRKVLEKVRAWGDWKTFRVVT